MISRAVTLYHFKHLVLTENSKTEHIEKYGPWTGIRSGREKVSPGKPEISRDTKSATTNTFEE